MYVVNKTTCGNGVGTVPDYFGACVSALTKKKKEGKLDAYAMKRAAHLPNPYGFLSLRNAQTIQPTTVWAPDDRTDYWLGTRR